MFAVRDAAVPTDKVGHCSSSGAACVERHPIRDKGTSGPWGLDFVLGQVPACSLDVALISDTIPGPFVPGTTY